MVAEEVEKNSKVSLLAEALEMTEDKEVGGNAWILLNRWKKEQDHPVKSYLMHHLSTIGMESLCTK